MRCGKGKGVAKFKPTKADKKRYRQLAELGCICCRKLGYQNAGEIHHLVEGYRLGNEFTICLCSWHHRGQPITTYKGVTAIVLGPNLRDNKKAFIKLFGTERELLLETDKWLQGESPQELKVRSENENSLPF